MKNKILIILPIFLLLFTNFALAGIDKLPVYNPFGRHLQYLTTGFSNATTQDLILESTGVSTTLIGGMNSSELNLTIVGNKSSTMFPAEGILIINNEALVYANMTLENVTNATVYLDKRGAYGTTAASHSSGVTVYFTKFLVGTNDSTTPFFVINTDGNIGINKVVPTSKFFVDGDANITDNLEVGENITLSDKITFRLGQIIDGITSAWIKLTGNVEITKGLTVAEDANISGTVNADTVNTTNLKAENLEQNLDATGYNITAIDEVAATLIDTTSLEADNLESDLDGTGYNITADGFLGYFYGVYDWFIGSGSEEYLAFNGTDLTFNETKLNETVGAYNDSMKTYVDAQDTTFNDSMKTYVDAQDTTFNDSMKTYVDAQDTTFNDSMKTYVDATFVEVSGDTMTGSLIIQGNLTVLGDEIEANVTTQYLNGSFLPSITDIFNIGSSTLKWADGYFNGNVNATNLYQGGNAVLDTSNEGNLDVNSSNHLNDFNTSTLANDDDDKLTIKQSWLETLFYTIAQIEVFNTSLYGIFYTQTEVEVINSSAVKVGENISSNYVTDTPAACSANSAMIQHGPSNFSTSTCADYWLNSAGNEEVTGPVNFTANVTSNAYYAEIWFHNDTGAGEVTIISTQAEYVNLTGFNTSDTAGQKLNGFSWNNGTEDLTANVAGLYMVIFDVSAGNAGVNVEMQFQTQVNGILQENSDAHRKIATGGDVGNCGDTAYIDLDVGDIIELVVRNNDGTDDVESFAASVNILRVAD